jgi:siroheme synthase
MGRLRDLAAASDTLVVMMARTNLAEVAAEIASVVGRERPAALVSKATWPDQRSVEGPISDIAHIADQAGIEPPATLIVGDVVSALSVSGLQLATG